MEIFAERAPWYLAGPLIGLLVVGLLWATNRPFGALGRGPRMARAGGSRGRS